MSLSHQAVNGDALAIEINQMLLVDLVQHAQHHERLHKQLPVLRRWDRVHDAFDSERELRFARCHLVGQGDVKAHVLDAQRATAEKQLVEALVESRRDSVQSAIDFPSSKPLPVTVHALEVFLCGPHVGAVCIARDCL